MKHELNTDERRNPGNDPDAKGNHAHNATSRCGRRRWAMRLMALLVACLPFVLLELGLRGLDNSDSQAIDRDPYVGLHQLRPLFVMNTETQRWEIPAERFNFFRPDSFSAHKEPGVRRVFVLGGSTVQGRPYATETAFSTWLRLSLESADDKSETRYEVVNCGGVSYASYRVARILEEVLQHEPDAIVLYTGHNEFLEDRTYAHVRDMSTASRWATAIGSKLHTVRWVQSFFTTPTERTDLAAEVDAKLDHQGGLESYQHDPAWRRGVEEHFATKLEHIVTLTLRNDVPLIMCVPASDLTNTPPIKTLTRSDWTDSERTEFQSAWATASDIESNVDHRIEVARVCLRIDPEHAGANYVLGRLLYEKGDSESARYLIAARDHDVCPLRAPTAIIQATRRVAELYGLPLVDTPRLLDERNVHGDLIPDKISDPSRFVDHLHPSIAGHQKIAAALVQEFQKLGWVEFDNQSQVRYEKAAKEHLRQLGEDYYVRGKQRLEGLRKWATGRAGQFATDSLPDKSEPSDASNQH